MSKIFSIHTSESVYDFGYNDFGYNVTPHFMSNSCTDVTHILNYIIVVLESDTEIIYHSINLKFPCASNWYNYGLFLPWQT